jgi:hypothetical protein
VWAYRARAHKPSLSFINRALVGNFSGPGSISGSHKKEMFLFAPQIKRKGSLSSWPIYISRIINRRILIKKDSLSFNRLFFFVNATKDL